MKILLAALAASLFAAPSFGQGTHALSSARNVLNGLFPDQPQALEALELPVAVPASQARAFSDPNSQDDDGTTSLMRAAKEGQNEVLTAILSQPGVKVDMTNSSGQTALMMAAISGRTEAARILLKAKADPNLQDNAGTNALMLAAYFGFTKTASALLEGGARINSRDADGNTPLILAAQAGRAETVDRLASVPGAELDAKNKIGTTALLEASMMDFDSDKIAVLIDRGADKNLAANYSKDATTVVEDYTALMVAAAYNNLPGVKILLDRKVNLNHRDRVDKKTALGIAKDGGSQELIDLLVAAGAQE